MLYDLADVSRHIVDLRRSRWDKERSVRDKGIYYFDRDPEAKVYIKVSDYQDDAARPQHILKFVDIEKIPYYRAKFGAEPVTPEDPYWPEPMVPTSDGKYIILDAILVKIANMEDYLDFRDANRKRGNYGADEENKRFNAETKSSGVSLKDEDVTSGSLDRGTSKH